MVETNAVFERDAIRPVVAGGIPDSVKTLIMPHIENHEYIMEAAMNCSKEAVVKAFLNDPAFTGKNCSEDDIRSLVNDMIAATMGYLPGGWK